VLRFQTPPGDTGENCFISTRFIEKNWRETAGQDRIDVEMHCKLLDVLVRNPLQDCVTVSVQLTREFVSEVQAINDLLLISRPLVQPRIHDLGRSNRDINLADEIAVASPSPRSIPSTCACA